MKASELLIEGMHNTVAANVSERSPSTDSPIHVALCSIWHERGVAFVTQQLANALESKQIVTHIYARWESERFSNGGNVCHTRVTNAGDDPTPAELSAWLGTNNISLYIQVEAHPNDFRRLQAVKDAGVHLMIYEHLELLRVDRLPRYAIADSFLCSTKSAYNFFTTHFPEKTAIFVPWGVDQELPLTPVTVHDPVSFLHISGWGGLNNRKNTDLVVRAFASTKGPAQLHLYSQAPLARYGDEILNLIRSDKRIVMHEGTFDDMNVAYAGKDILLCPSKREGLGLPIVEALAAGLTVIVSDGHTMKEWIVPSGHGLVCPARPGFGDRVISEVIVDEAALSALIQQFIDDPKRVESLKRNVQRDRSLWCWSWQKELLRGKFVQLARSGALDFNLAELPPFYLDFLATSEQRTPSEMASLGCP